MIFFVIFLFDIKMKGKGFDPLLSRRKPGVFPLHQPFILLLNLKYPKNNDL